MAHQNYLNISYGTSQLEGFINILLPPNEDPHEFSRNGIPFPDRSAQGIYSYGIIERLSQTGILIFLRECRRVLQAGGIIRVSTADLQYLINRYIAGDWRNPLLSRQGANWVQNKAEYLNVEMRHWDRTWICDSEELTRLAKLAGLEADISNPITPDPHSPFRSIPIEAESRLILEFSKQNHIRHTAPLVSIVIPAYRPDFLVACLDSAFAQTYSDLEIVVCDDSKVDEVQAIIQSYANRHIPITFVRNPSTLGEAQNLTQAINLAKGEFIKPLYDDDLLAPECVDELVSAFLRTPDARLAVCQRLPIDEYGNPLDVAPLGTPLAQQSTRLSGQAVIADIVDGGINTLGEPTVMLFRRDDVLTMGEPDVMSLFGRRCAGIGDVGLALKLLSRGDLAYVAKPVAYFRRHSGQNQNRPEFDKWMRASWAYVQAQAARLGLNKDGLITAPISSDADYSAWLQLRTFVPEDFNAIDKATHALGSSPPNFQILLRLRPCQDTLLADTLDTLASQVYPNWQLEIITSLAPPEGIDEIANLGWHLIETEKDEKEVIDFLVNSRGFQWALELPTGAKLDPLYLWRLAIQTKTSPETRAFFCDDDLCDAVGTRFSPRFKPGVNPSALLSSDLAGPICVRCDSWEAIGGTCQRGGSPWFSQQLRIAEKFGWSSIEHIPDVLISYPGTFPTDTESCISALFEQLGNKENSAEIIPVSTTSWHIRYPLSAPPGVSIAILSYGQLDLLTRCLSSIIETTRYPNLEILIVLEESVEDPDLPFEIAKIECFQSPKIRTVRTTSLGNKAKRCNVAVSAASNDLVLLIEEGAVVIQSNWLEELVRTCLQPDIAAASPRLIRPGTALIENAGNVIGLCGTVGSPYQGEAKIGDSSYLGRLQVAHDVSALSSNCMLIHKAEYLAVGGMDEVDLGETFSDADLCQKLIACGKRLIYQALATVVDGSCPIIGNELNEIRKTKALSAEIHANEIFSARWLKAATVDPFFNPNLSLAKLIPSPETDYRAQWQYLPSSLPRFLVRTLPNAQGDLRVTSPLRALRKIDQATECIWPQVGPREPTTAEIIRLSPEIFIVQHYLRSQSLATLDSLHRIPGRPFTVYAIDDLLTDMDESNPFRGNIPANSRAHLKYALDRCDRMVASTEFLAETYRRFIPDIRVVPNRLEQDIWLPLQSQKRTGDKPRIGWAGGTTHRSDLLMLKEIIEQTRDEADWIFFGMCPDEIQPLLSEYHASCSFSEYPTRLARLNLDIAIAPLAHTLFNQAKSNLRLLEFGVLSIPVVCTDIQPYHNSPACCITNRPEAWLEALRERIHDADAREKEGATMRKWVEQYYLLENNLDEWLTAHLPS
ncbi:glycosyltransferase [Ferribacterium limneticum]|uniref:glycosyltransferase n=1 Tax=Ferribacterium limneticum TaxID=76259 RepID=UPI001CF95996|nr:glycosyltransferase [Ferribacterium limneticum]UCV19775.1 glycosyltransferase [Ferribacterium limneticum]